MANKIRSLGKIVWLLKIVVGKNNSVPKYRFGRQNIQVKKSFKNLWNHKRNFVREKMIDSSLLFDNYT